MSQLYNLFEGSLPELQRRVEEAAEPNTPEALDEAVEATWEPVNSIIPNLLDWHEQDTLLDQAKSLPGNGGILITKLFTSPPLGIRPHDFGFQGALTANGVAELRNVLEAAVGAWADQVEKDRSLWNFDLADSEDPLEGPARVLVGIRPVQPGKDLILLL